MEQQFWEKVWHEGKTGFQQAQINPLLKENVGKLVNNPTAELSQAAIFVPLSGNSIDLSYLTTKFKHTVANEFVPHIYKEFADKNELNLVGSNMTNSFSLSIFTSAKLAMIGGSYFDINRQALAVAVNGDLNSADAVIDCIYDRAALVALNPADREKYIANQYGFLKPNGRLLLMTIEHNGGSGPPWSIPEADVKALFAKWEKIEKLGSRSLGRSAKRADGKLQENEFNEQAWLIYK